MLTLLLFFFCLTSSISFGLVLALLIDIHFKCKAEVSV